ncbi:MAG: transketolase [Nitrospinaceae bacterium]|nr:transketolase [Nitrospinaceae bacterium]NIR56612.1 transketolase [Nitrospinaceae bacterium]NIS87075.1 transketolase [Nitrospinaceae bacterium]NIT83929.1 transketolase [Nitrospinaceae bacterium]NIU46120.1 transketolase [Nitrospinaceae bacterium]
MAELEQRAKALRRKSLEIIHRAGSGHPGGSLSAADLVAALFFGGVLKYDPKNPKDPDRDRFILSKGHATGLLYSTLAWAGYFDEKDLGDYRKINSKLYLSGHPHPRTPGVEIASGSLGQGLSVGHGMALGARLDQKNYRVYVLLGDGEIQEGQIWEAAMSAAKFKSDNLIALIDNNHVAQDSVTKELKDLEPLDEKWRAFGWDVHRIDGHHMETVLKTLRRPPEPGKPRVIIADTVKGKGVSFMEGQTGWHGKAPNEEELEKALKELQ